MKKVMLLMAGAFLVFSLSCNDNTTEEERPYNLDEPMPRKLLEMLDSLPIVHVELDDVILPNGLAVRDFKKSYPDLYKTNASPRLGPVDDKCGVILNLMDNALYLAERDFFQYPDEGYQRPAQNGLAFVWGSKDINKRNWPGSQSTCREYLYGLDCSGYIHQVFKRSGIPLPASHADVLRRTSTLEKAIKSAYPESKIKVEDLGQIDPSLIESGDIVYWKRPDNMANHIGMFAITRIGLGNERHLVLVNSSGGQTSCYRNKSKDGGPVIKDFEYAKGRLSESPYGIVRINVANAWTLRLRCSGQSKDAFSTVLSISEMEDLDEQITANFSDYNGKPLSYTFQLQYDKNTKILFLQATLASGKRVDVVQIKLDKEDTNYMDMQRVVAVEGTCQLQVRLVKGHQSSTFKQRQLTEAKEDGEGTAAIYLEPM